MTNQLLVNIAEILVLQLVVQFFAAARMVRAANRVITTLNAPDETVRVSVPKQPR